MMPDEKERLLTLFDDASKWCQNCEARDGSGNPVSYTDETAVAWDIVGGMCRLFGWRRACQLFGQMHRHIGGPQRILYGQSEDMVAMAALFDFNDAGDTTFDKVVVMIRDMPVWGRTLSAEKPTSCEIRDPAGVDSPDLSSETASRPPGSV